MLLQPSIESNVFSPYNSRHEIERDYLNEVDEMIRCKDNIFFDRAKLDKLKEILERHNKSPVYTTQTNLGSPPVSCSRVYTFKFQICSVNEIWGEPRLF